MSPLSLMASGEASSGVSPLLSTCAKSGKSGSSGRRALHGPRLLIARRSGERGIYDRGLGMLSALFLIPSSHWRLSRPLPGTINLQ